MLQQADGVLLARNTRPPDLAHDVSGAPPSHGSLCPPRAPQTAAPQPEAYSTVTGILPMRACHSLGAVLCTLVPLESTATVTGMSRTSNS